MDYRIYISEIMDLGLSREQVGVYRDELQAAIDSDPALQTALEDLEMGDITVNTFDNVSGAGAGFHSGDFDLDDRVRAIADRVLESITCPQS